MRGLALIAALAAGPVSAALSPCVYDDLVAEAQTVVQIDDISLGSAPLSRRCKVSGTVRAVIRGEAALGERITVRVPCRNPDGMVGPDIYTAPEALRAASAAELHLSEAGTITGYGDGFVLIDAITGTEARVPYCGP